MNRAVAIAALRAVQEAKRGAAEQRTIAIGGARELVPLVAKELRRGGEAAAVTESFGDGAAALVWIGSPDDQVLRAASLARVPIVGVTEGERLPYVLDTNLVRIVPGRGLPVDEIAAALGRVLGARGPGLAARLPVLRRPVVDQLIGSAARRNAMLGAKAWLPGVELPMLSLNQLRLVLGIAIAGGRTLDAGLWPELLGVAGVAYGWRRVAGSLDGLAVTTRVVRGAVVFAGTVAVGAAARRHLA